MFGTDRTADGFPGYASPSARPDGGAGAHRSGFQLTPHADLGPVDGRRPGGRAGAPEGTSVPAPGARRAAPGRRARARTLLSVCSGAFVLGAAGLLDGRECTTHWRYVDELQRRYPARPGRAATRSTCQDGKLLTSAGTAAGIDACLHLVRQEHGSAIATRLARRMVVPPHRDGGQAQYIEAPIPKAPEAPTLEPVLEWLMGHLDRPVTVDELAARADMAPRTFARRFRAETGTTPHDWLTNQRVLLARRLLEETDAERGGGRRPGRLRRRGGAAAPLHAAGSAPPRTATAAPSGTARTAAEPARRLGPSRLRSPCAPSARDSEPATYPPSGRRQIACPYPKTAGSSVDGDLVPPGPQSATAARPRRSTSVGSTSTVRPACQYQRGRVQRRLRVEPVVHGGRDHLHVPLRLHVAAHHPERARPASPPRVRKPGNDRVERPLARRRPRSGASGRARSPAPRFCSAKPCPGSTTNEPKPR